MKKILAMIVVMLLIGVLLIGMAFTAWAAEEGGELPTVTAPPVTEAPEEPIITAMPDELLEPEDAGATDTHDNDNTTPSEETEEGGVMAAQGVGTVSVIVVICLGLGQVIKTSPLDNKWIPAIMVPAGAALGFLAFHVMPGFPAGDPITAVAVGIASGMSATGANQIYKQLHG